MKQKTMYLLMIVALMATMLPTAAFAAAPAELKVWVRNQTDAVASLQLVDADGNPIFIDVEPGLSHFMLTEGQYSLYVSTVCGAYSETVKVDSTKTLFLGCKDGQTAPVVDYGKCTWVGTGELRFRSSSFEVGPMVRFANFDGLIDIEALWDKIRNHSPYDSFDEYRMASGYTSKCLYGLQPEDYLGYMPFNHVR